MSKVFITTSNPFTNLIAPNLTEYMVHINEVLYYILECLAHIERSLTITAIFYFLGDVAQMPSKCTVVM